MTASPKLGHAVLFMILGSYFLSQAFTWYGNLRQIDGAAESAADTAVRLMLQVPLLVGFALVLHSGALRRMPQSLRILATLATASFVLSAVRGLMGAVFDDYGLRYVFGDAFRLLVSWGGLFGVIGARILLGGSATRARRLLVTAIVLIAMLDALVTMFLYFRFNMFKISTSAYMPGVYLGIAYLSRYPVRAIFPLLFGLGAIMLSGKRSPVIVFVLVTVVMLLLKTLTSMLRSGQRLRFSPRRLVRLLLTSTTAILLIAAAILALQASAGDAFTGRINALSDSVTAIIDGFVGKDDMDISYQSRLYEWENVLAYYESNRIDLIFGAGIGAEIPMVFDTSVYTDTGRMHHAHISWVVYLLRNGLFGVILLVSYFVIVGSLISRKALMTTGGSGLLLAGLMQLLSDLITSFKANIMLETFSILPAVAIAWALSTGRVASRQRRAIRNAP